MKRCKTCKSWEPFKGTGWGKCARAGSTSSEPDDPTSLATAQDAESYAAHLQTQALFGCIQ
jgi:hypothetical protein